VVKKRWALLFNFDIALEVVNDMGFVARRLCCFYQPAR
jgi:hypothetical protein